MNYVILIGIALFFVVMTVRDGAMGWDFSGDSMNFRIADGDYSLQVKSHGDVDLEPDGSGVAALDSGGSFDVGLRRNGLDRRALFTSENGTIERQYFVEGQEQPWGADADRFVGEALPIVLRETAINAAERVAWLIANRGHTGLLDEIDLIRSDFAQRVYTVEFAQTTELAEADLTRLMRTAARNMSSDFDARTVLEHLGPKLPSSAEAAGAYLDLAATISSDFDMRLALQPLVTRADVDDEIVARAIDLATHDISSDFDLRTLLSESVGRVGESDALARAYTTATRSISSDFNQREALAVLAQGAELTPQGWALLLESARDISSDFDAAALLTAVAPVMPLDDAVIEAYRRTLDTIGSDFDRGRAAAALEDARRRAR
jgi:hypothetical protein